ncbi:MAG: hypothetical protein JKX74_06980, partial [Flavobacteriales bacterium]|nr:hypothetical protein [Flavobacteriales bacterium]
KLSTALDKLGFAEKMSKRINGQPRNVYPVVERGDYEEEEYQRELRKEIDQAAKK